MNRLMVLGGGVCLLLGGLIAVELLTAVRTDGPTGAEMPQAAAASPEPAPLVSSDAKALAQVIEARPLFSASRRPVARIQPAILVNMAVKPFTRRLTGVVLEPSIRAAVFTGEGNGRGIIVKEGEPIEGWFLESVTPAGVTLRAAGASQVIELPKGKKGANGQSTGAKPVVPSFLSPSLRLDR